MSAIQLFGPTASGKSALAEALASEFDLDLISVDSALVYRGLDIGSAKPPMGMRERYRLIDVCEPEERYSAAQFVADTQAALAESAARGRVALLVGGTGLYFRALNHGLSDLPAADPAVRALLEQQLQALGHAALHARLQQLDPLAATRIHPADTQRLLRALEVIELTGQPLSAQQHGPQHDPQRAADLRIAWAPHDRSWLHARIAQRLHDMFTQGFVEEVRGLMQRPHLTAEHPSMRAVGYRQVWDALAHARDLSEAEALALYATRQLAKRQYTWLRGEAHWQLWDAQDPAAVVQVSAAVAHWLQRQRG